MILAYYCSSGAYNSGLDLEKWQSCVEKSEIAINGIEALVKYMYLEITEEAFLASKEGRLAAQFLNITVGNLEPGNSQLIQACRLNCVFSVMLNLHH